MAGEGWKQEKALQTQVGATFTIRLWEDRTRGEIYVPQYDAEALSLVNDDYERTIGDSANVVDSGKRVLEFLARKPGVHRIVFEKRMGWKFTAEDRRVYAVTVDGEDGPR
jgi:predicted secreted protein